MDEHWASALQYNPYAQPLAYATSSSAPMADPLDNVSLEYQYCFRVHPSFTYAHCPPIWENQLSFVYPATTFPTESESIGRDGAYSVTSMSNLVTFQSQNQDLPEDYLPDHDSDPDIDFDGDEVINQEIL